MYHIKGCYKKFERQERGGPRYSKGVIDHSKNGGVYSDAVTFCSNTNSLWRNKCIATRWTPTLKVNKNIKIARSPTDDRTDGQTDILYYHSGDLNPLCEATCTKNNYGPHK